MKIGVLGGTFDPVHNGHLYMAGHCMDKLCLDKVMFLPNGNPPHKRGRNVTDKIHRYNMLNIALNEYEDFFVSDYEINREDYSYTVETMRYMRSLNDDKYTIIIGADSFYQLESWYRFSVLVRENEFVVLDREYMGHSSIEADIKEFNNKYKSKIRLCKMPVIDISSTCIREMISSGKDVSDMIPERVYRYIADNKLYR